jgi:hypothetical protein
MRYGPARVLCDIGFLRFWIANACGAAWVLLGRAPVPDGVAQFVGLAQGWWLICPLYMANLFVIAVGWAFKDVGLSV